MVTVLSLQLVTSLVAMQMTSLILNEEMKGKIFFIKNGISYLCSRRKRKKNLHQPEAIEGRQKIGLFQARNARLDGRSKGRVLPGPDKRSLARPLQLWTEKSLFRAST